MKDNHRNLRVFHVVTPIVYFISLLLVLFSNDNPVIVTTILLIMIELFTVSGNGRALKKGFYIFIPLALLMTGINMLFVTEGRTTLFVAFGKRFTLESVIYAAILSVKLLTTVYLFMLLDIMIDSDRAVSYFSTVMPKTTLMMMVGFKLMPGMKDRFSNLKEIYSMRGVNYEGKSMTERIKSHIPIITILLDDCLEGSFQIGEAAYVRGFLSTERSVYDRQKFRNKDKQIVAACIMLVLAYVGFKVTGKVDFNVYNDANITKVMNYGIAVIFTMIIFTTAGILVGSEGLDNC